MVLSLFRRRRGPAANFTPEVPAGTLVYAVGDIHGCATLLQRLHERIRAHAHTVPAERRVVVYLGDYVDRGMESRQVIDLLLDEPLEGFETVYLRGNHEDWMLHFLEEPAAGAGWLGNGGNATLLSYGVGNQSSGTLADRLAAMSEALKAELPPEHLQFLESTRFAHVEGDYAFVHAGVRPGIPIEEQSPDDLMWIREEFLMSNEAHDKIIVHGHTISEQPEMLLNRIGIDTGAFATGQLTALALHGGERQLLQP